MAATVRVGNELGAGNPTQAKRAAYISLALGGQSSFLLFCQLDANFNVVIASCCVNSKWNLLYSIQI